MRITRIELKFHTDTGETISASVAHDAGWQQWGADARTLGANVDLIEAIAQAAADHGVGNGDGPACPLD